MSTTTEMPHDQNSVPKQTTSDVQDASVSPSTQHQNEENTSHTKLAELELEKLMKDKDSSEEQQVVDQLLSKDSDASVDVDPSFILSLSEKESVGATDASTRTTEPNAAAEHTVPVPTSSSTSSAPPTAPLSQSQDEDSKPESLIDASAAGVDESKTPQESAVPALEAEEKSPVPAEQLTQSEDDDELPSVTASASNTEEENSVSVEAIPSEDASPSAPASFGAPLSLLTDSAPVVEEEKIGSLLNTAASAFVPGGQFSSAKPVVVEEAAEESVPVVSVPEVKDLVEEETSPKAEASPVHEEPILKFEDETPIKAEEEETSIPVAAENPFASSEDPATPVTSPSVDELIKAIEEEDPIPAVETEKPKVPDVVPESLFAPSEAEVKVNVEVKDVEPTPEVIEQTAEAVQKIEPVAFNIEPVVAEESEPALKVEDEQVELTPETVEPTPEVDDEVEPTPEVIEQAREAVEKIEPVSFNIEPAPAVLEEKTVVDDTPASVEESFEASHIAEVPEVVTSALEPETPSPEVEDKTEAPAVPFIFESTEKPKAAAEDSPSLLDEPVVAEEKVAVEEPTPAAEEVGEVPTPEAIDAARAAFEKVEVKEVEPTPEVIEQATEAVEKIEPVSFNIEPAGSEAAVIEEPIAPAIGAEELDESSMAIIEAEEEKVAEPTVEEEAKPAGADETEAREAVEAIKAVAFNIEPSSIAAEEPSSAVEPEVSDAEDARQAVKDVRAVALEVPSAKDIFDINEYTPKDETVSERGGEEVRIEDITTPEATEADLETPAPQIVIPDILPTAEPADISPVEFAPPSPSTKTTVPMASVPFNEESESAAAVEESVVEDAPVEVEVVDTQEDDTPIKVEEAEVHIPAIEEAPEVKPFSSLFVEDQAPTKVLAEVAAPVVEDVLSPSEPEVEEEVVKAPEFDETPAAVEDIPVSGPAAVEEFTEERNVPAIVTDDDAHVEDDSVVAPSEIERPRSPWTASYSVSSQGPGTPSPSTEKTLGELEDDFPAETTSLRAPTPTDRPRSPWSPSYSVSTQGASRAEPELEKLEQLPLPVTQEEVVVPEVIEESTAETRDTLEAVAPETDASSLRAPTPIDRPRSPWSPSYAVTSQGSVRSELELETLEQLPPPVITSELAVLDSAPEVDVKEDEEPQAPIESEIIPPSNVPELAESEDIPIAAAVAMGAISLDEPEPVVAVEEPIAEVEHLEESNKEAEPQPEPVLEDTSIPNAAFFGAGLIGAGALAAGALQLKDDDFPSVNDSRVVVDEAPKVEEQNAPGTSRDLLTPSPRPSEIARPRSPWTPSYAVTTQGPNGGNDEAEIEQLEQLPPATTTESKAETASLAPSANDISRPKSPYTPAYAVTSQGPRTPPVEDLPATQEPEKSKVVSDFPVVQEEKSASKPLLRVATIEDIAGAVANSDEEPTSAYLDAPATSPGRKRLESTTSSRFFPGGWYASSPKIERATDIAEGEFSPATNVAPANTPTSAYPASPAKEEDKRWCVIM